MSIDTSFWHGKRVLLTGHTGFKGSWLSLWLQTMGAQVLGYALAPPTQPSLFVVAKVSDGLTSIIGDVRDLNALSAELAKFMPEIIIHLAAQPLVRYSYQNPVETYATNVLGTVHLLDAVRSTPSVKAVLCVTTDKCYENREWLWGYREHEALGGYDPYSSSKACAELVTAAYRNAYFSADSYAQHGVAVASARAGNVIGGGDWAADRLIPDILHALSENRPVLIRNPNAIRPWQHVLEPLSGYLLLAQKLYEHGPAYAEAWNFGPQDDDAKPVHWLADTLIKAWGGNAQWQLEGGNHPHEAHYLKLDCSKAKSRLNWFPQWPLATALDAIVDWQQHYLQGADMRAVCLRQIADYQASVKA